LRQDRDVGILAINATGKRKREKAKIMGKISTIQDILDTEDKAIVYAFKGTVAEIWKENAGVNKRGEDYCIQNMMLKDAQGKQIKCKFDNRDPAPLDWKGREIHILAHNGKKGWSGVYAIDDNYPAGKITRIIKVTASAEVICGNSAQSGGENGQNRAINAPDGKVPQHATQGKQTQPGAIQAPNPAQSVVTARKILAKQSNLMLLCLDAAAYVREKFIKRHPNIEFTTDQFQAVTSSFYIHMAGRQFDDYSANFPIDDIHAFIDALRKTPSAQKPDNTKRSTKKGSNK
jgi:hypothetical protein